MMTPPHWAIIVISGAFGAAGIWAQRFMFRHPIPGMLIRYLLDFLFALLGGVAVALSSLPIEKAILATALLTGLMYGHVFFDSLLIFDCYETGTAETSE